LSSRNILELLLKVCIVAIVVVDMMSTQLSWQMVTIELSPRFTVENARRGIS